MSAEAAKILIVEDEGIIAKDIQLRLTEAGYSVCGITNSGEDAIRRAEELKPDLILMDIRIKGPMDGIATAEVLTGVNRIPVVFLTSHADPETLTRAKAASPFGYIVKPLAHTSNLTACVEMALNRHRIETDLVSKSKQSEEENRAKSQFLASITHEIRTPLSILLGAADLLSDSQLHPIQKQYVELCQRAGGNLKRLVDDILDLAKAQSGRLELEQIPYDLHELATTTLEMIKVRATDKPISFSVQIAPEVPRQVIGDPVRLQQILLNLLGNAVKFTDIGEIGLSLKARSSAPKGYIEISVCDTGIGIPADKVDKIFDDYVQAESSTTRIFGGTGLGLGIARNLVHLMGGEIGVESVVAKGSRFYFDVQLIASDEDEAGKTQVGTQIRARSSDTPLRILLADDSEDICLLVQHFLADINCPLAIVNNGSEAVAAATSDRFDLLLIDMQMPVMDGISAIAAIRQHESANSVQPAYIVALTGNSTPDEIARCKEAGCNLHVAKPISKLALLAAVERACSELSLPTPQLTAV